WHRVGRRLVARIDRVGRGGEQSVWLSAALGADAGNVGASALVLSASKSVRLLVAGRKRETGFAGGGGVESAGRRCGGSRAVAGECRALGRLDSRLESV